MVLFHLQIGNTEVCSCICVRIRTINKIKIKILVKIVLKKNIDNFVVLIFDNMFCYRKLR